MAGNDELRVADTDRERVAARLGQAHTEGRLTLAEYDERVRTAHAAVVGSDLVPLTADLPTDPPTEAPTRSASMGAASSSGRRRSPIRAAVTTWAVVSVINLVIWVAVSAATGGVVAPWWIWVAGPWGIVLAVRALAGRAGLALPGPCSVVPIRR